VTGLRSFFVSTAKPRVEIFNIASPASQAASLSGWSKA
jgi:hypothetical protein